jgi:hypothetical protein
MAAKWGQVDYPTNQPAHFFMRLVENGRKSSLLPAALSSARAGKGTPIFSIPAGANETNIVEYDRIGAVSGADLVDLVELGKEAREEVLRWLRERRPELLQAL